MEGSVTCPFCNFSLSQDLFFCPYCGKKLKDKPLSTTLLRQVVIYLMSFFFAPLGLVWAFKYMRQNDPVSKRIGIVIIILTLFAIIILTKIASSFYTSLYSVYGITDLYP